MSIINFSIPKQLEKRVEQTIRNKGFSSKAEFFRFAAIYFMDILEKQPKDEEERFAQLTEMVKEEARERYTGKKIPPLEDQLKDV